MKHCNRCNTTKPFSEFNNNSRSPDGKQSYCHVCRLDQMLIRRYNINIEQRQSILESQGGCCSICKSKLEFPTRGNHRNSNVVGRAYAVVDHCHSTGKIRGILCGKCNLMLGKAEDNIEYLKSAIKYLEKYND
jgi:hypothetical protein